MDTPKVPGKARASKQAVDGDRTERITVGIVLFVLAVVPLLTFLFSFGNVGNLGVGLHVDWRIAYLTGPAVDLTATGMIVAATWLSHKGRTEKELWPIHVLSVICALMMFGLNCGPAIYVRRYQLAAFDAVGPFLLMAMGLVGPWLLRQITDARTVAGADGSSQKTSSRKTVTAAATPPAIPAATPGAQPATVAAAATATTPPVAAAVTATRPPVAASNTASSNGNSVTTLIPRAGQLQIVRELVATHGRDVALAEIQSRVGGHKSTASRLRAAVLEELDAEPERAEAVI